MFTAGMFLPAIGQDPAYHHFADQRIILGIPNFWNVISNAAFLVAAIFGFRVMRSMSAFRQDWERLSFVMLASAAALVAFGSGFYHAAPNSHTLFWDRLPMTVVFMSLFATTIGERIDTNLGRKILAPLIAIGLASVLWWRVTGDLRLYAAVQFYPMLAIVLLVIFRESSYSSSAGVAMPILYGLAKLAELYDHEIGTFCSMGGHPLKHVLSAAALFCYIRSVARREPINKRVKTVNNDILSSAQASESVQNILAFWR